MIILFLSTLVYWNFDYAFILLVFPFIGNWTVVCSFITGVGFIFDWYVDLIVMTFVFVASYFIIELRI